MKKVVGLILALILCLSLIPAGFADDISFSDDPKAIQKASNSVVMLSCYGKDGNMVATGSAFAAFDEGIFVTNYHVTEGVYSIKAQMETGLEFKIDTVVAFDSEKDITILRTDAITGLEPLPLGDSSKIERGEKVIAIGSPLGLINTISIGLYSGKIKDDGVYLQFSAPISHGSSGGALFNDAGEVIGITFATLEEGQNINFAIPIEAAQALYQASKMAKYMSMEAFYNTFVHELPKTTVPSPKPQGSIFDNINQQRENGTYQEPSTNATWRDCEEAIRESDPELYYAIQEKRKESMIQNYLNNQD